MIERNDMVCVGSSHKPHGVGGELSCSFSRPVFDDADPECLFLEMDGLLVPFFVEDYRFKTDITALLKFEGIDSEQQARRLGDKKLYVHRDQCPQAADDLGALTGYELIDAATGRSLGRIAQVDDSTANVLFVLHDGRLVPVADEWVDTIDDDRRVLLMNLPEGLMEIN